ncbi:unnamed protein product [Anisakis simplex]|uniref:BSD domain-containing protein n=1 Tax=Anisakis simplex TaxID=6269 RepID=A0A0M3KC21_ANISI|nr:unnamed protein product [Anisakis simplex]
MAPSGELLLSVEHVKYRSQSASRSPIGTFTVYEDRVVWKDNTSDDNLVISFNDIRGQRVSPPNKSKTQLQICLNDEQQPTFVFVNPAGDKEVHVKERDLVKETLQQALIRHRQLANQAVLNAQKYGRAQEMQAKKKLLEQDTHLKELYKHLVASKLIPAQDFWTDYYNAKDESNDEKLGVSGGFLSSIAQSEGTNGVKLNLNVDTIQSIFKTYPAVEKKHLELVPHEMTEQQFWSQFFQSHYFHRERTVAVNPTDPFADCVKADTREMNKMLELPISHKALDFAYLSDVPKLTDTNNEAPVIQEDGLSSKALLVRRCNYHSGRVLMSAQENSLMDSGKSEKHDKSKSMDPCSSSKLYDEDTIEIESAELEDENPEEIWEEVTLCESDLNATSNQLSPERYQELSLIVKKLAAAPTTPMEVDSDVMFGDDNFSWLTNGSMQNGDANGHKESEHQQEKKELKPHQLAQLALVHDACAELLKHFWSCMPPNTKPLQEKVTAV